MGVSEKHVNGNGTPAIRLAHLSDVHVTTRQLGWRTRDWFSKRVTGWINLRCLGRGKNFRHSERILDVLVPELCKRQPDRVIFSGDATALGFEAEFVRAVRALGVA